MCSSSTRRSARRTVADAQLRGAHRAPQRFAHVPACTRAPFTAPRRPRRMDANAIGGWRAAQQDAGTYPEIAHRSFWGAVD